MPIQYYVVENKLTVPASYTARPSAISNVDIKGICSLINAKNPTITQSMAETCLTLLSSIVEKEILDGNSVTLTNFVSFTASISARLTDYNQMFARTDLNPRFIVSQTFIADVEALASYTRLGVISKVPSIVSATDANTKIEDWIRQGYGLDIKGNNLDFNKDDPEQGVFLSSPAGNTYRVENVAYTTGKRIIAIPTIDQAEGPAGAGSVAYGLEVRSRYTPGGDLRIGSWPWLRKTDTIGQDNDLLFVRGTQATGPVRVSAYAGDPVTIKMVAAIDQSNILTITASQLSMQTGSTVQINGNGTYNIELINGLQIEVTDYDLLYSTVLQSQRHMQEIVNINEVEPPMPTISMFGVSDYTTFAVMSDGAVYSSGFNAYGQLGDGSMINKSDPNHVDSDVVFVKIKAGSNSVYAIASDGSLWSWGYNGVGQLGHGDTTNRISPVQVGSDTDWADIFSGASAQSAFAIKSDGTMWAVGVNTYGQLGLGDTTNRSTFTQVGSDTDWSKVYCAYRHTIAFKDDNTMMSTGYNNNGQLALGDRVTRNTFTQSATSGVYTAAAPADYHTTLLKADGTLWGCGDSQFGVLGDIPANWINTTILQIGNATNWVKITASVSVTCAINSDGELYATGENRYGQFGIAVTQDYYYAMTLTGFSGVCEDVSVGARHVIAKGTDGSLYSTGANNYGQLGVGTFVGSEEFIINEFI
jgi:alpha-tubulin suppressor-like RCC1 family protein